MVIGSDLIHFDVLGSHIVVVNSAKAANELFEKRSAIYSDRFVSSFACTHSFWSSSNERVDRPSFTALTDL